MYVERAADAPVVMPDAAWRADPLATEESDGSRVLIVDDSEINRRILTGMLRQERYTLLSAADGEQAMALARTARPDLILLDIVLPGADGYQVCAALKADPRTARIPVIFLSALSEVADKIRGLELGAVDYITKPFDRGEVLARVRSQLKIQRLATELLEANVALHDRQARLEEDLQAAGAIQHTLLPSEPPAVRNVRVGWRFMPCGRVGGDLFNFCPLGDDALAVFVIDVSGHGVPAAMVTVSLSQYLSPPAGHLLARAGGAALPLPASPAEVLARLEQEYPIERFGKFFTIAYVVIDHRRGRLRYSLGGHPRPLLHRADGRIEVLDAGGPLIGMDSGLPFDEAEVALHAGDRLLLYTDGLVDVLDPAGHEFGLERLYEVVRATRALPFDAVCGRVLEEALAFAAAVEPPDDITLLAIEFSGVDDREVH